MKRYDKIRSELGHEKNNYYVMFKGANKFWKVFSSKRHAEKAAETLRKKGKEVTVGPTAASVSGKKLKESVLKNPYMGLDKKVIKRKLDSFNAQLADLIKKSRGRTRKDLEVEIERMQDKVEMATAAFKAASRKGVREDVSEAIDWDKHKGALKPVDKKTPSLKTSKTASIVYIEKLKKDLEKAKSKAAKARIQKEIDREKEELFGESKIYDCKKCKGTGKLKQGVNCPHCSGTGIHGYNDTHKAQRIKSKVDSLRKTRKAKGLEESVEQIDEGVLDSIESFIEYFKERSDRKHVAAVKDAMAADPEFAEIVKNGFNNKNGNWKTGYRSKFEKYVSNTMSPEFAKRLGFTDNEYIANPNYMKKQGGLMGFLDLIFTGKRGKDYDREIKTGKKIGSPRKAGRRLADIVKKRRNRLQNEEEVKQIDEGIKAAVGGRGYHGEMSKQGKDADKEFAKKHAEIMKNAWYKKGIQTFKRSTFGKNYKTTDPSTIVNHFLSSAYGRNMADWNNGDINDKRTKNAFNDFMKSYSPTFFEGKENTMKLDEGYKARKSEHGGAKKGKGAFYGRKKDAKKDSNKLRRADDKASVNEEQLDELTDKQRAEIAARKKKREDEKAAKKAKAAENKAKREKNKGARGGEGAYDKEDDHVIMQFRKAQDVDGNMDIKFGRNKTGKVSKDDIDAVLSFHDKLSKPDDKRRMRIKLAKGGVAAAKQLAAVYRKTVGK